MGGQTQVLILGDQARRAPLMPPTIEFAVDVPASVLLYAEAAGELPWASLTSLGDNGRRVPLPMELWVRTATAWPRASALSARWRVPSWGPSQSCAGLRELQVVPTTTAPVVRWSDHEVLAGVDMLFEIRSRYGTLPLGRATHLISNLTNVGPRLAVAAHAAKATCTWVAADGPSEPVPTRVVAFAGQPSISTGATAFAWLEDGTVGPVTTSTIGPAIASVTLDPLDSGNAIYTLGPDLVVRRSFTSLHYPATSPNNSVEPLTRPFLREITAVALLPTLGTSPDGHRLGAIAAATAVLPGAPEDQRTAILLRYSDQAGEWRPHAILDEFERVTQLAEHDGEVLFAGDAGWGVYSPKNGACRGEGTIAPVEQLVALADGSFYLVGLDRQDRRPVAAWLIPE